MLDKSDPPPPPDYGPIANASKESAELAYKIQKEQLEWARQRYAEDKIVTDKVVDSYLDSQKKTREAADKDRKRYEEVFQPIEDQLVADAKDYSSPERREKEVGRAISDVAQQFDVARENAQRELEAFGINPASTRYAALDIGTRTQQAATQAAAGTQAGERVDATGRALRESAINLGKGYPSQSLAAYGASYGAGAGATGSQLGLTASGANTMGTGLQWGQAGNQALNTWGNTLNMGYNNQMASHRAEQDSSSGIGALLGAGAGLAGRALLGPTMPWIFAEGGGAIEDPMATTGGQVPPAASPSAGAQVDDVNAALNVGEFVLPRDVTSWIGEEKLQKMILKARKDKQGAAAKPTMGPPRAGAITFQSQGAPPQGAIQMGGGA